MKGSNILWAGGGLIFGTAIGFFVGYYVMGKETAKMYDEELAMMDQKVKALQDMMPEKNFEDNEKSPELKKPKEPSVPKREVQTDYTKYTKKISEINAEYEQNCIAEKNALEDHGDPADSIAPTDEDDDDDQLDDNYDEEIALANQNAQEEMYLELVREYKNIHGDDIMVLWEGDRDPDYPNLEYDHKDLYWFVGDDVVTDDEGNLVDEEALIGHELRDSKWQDDPDNDTVWVRNNSLEIDYCVYRYTGTSSDFWIRGKQ